MRGGERERINELESVQKRSSEIHRIKKPGDHYLPYDGDDGDAALQR